VKTSSWILFADLDGTVLDRENYEPGPALAALERCREASVPVVLNSSKTRAEMEFFYDRLPILPGTPFVSENGGGVFLPREFWERPPGAEETRTFWKVTLGARHETLLPALRRAVERLGLPVRLFSDLPAEEIARATGLPLDQAGLARDREFDEPFWLEGEDPAALTALREALDGQGLRLTRGGRCFHVHGVSDKGRAVDYVMERYRQERPDRVVRSAGVGDASNDLPLLRAVEKAYLVQQAHGAHDPELPDIHGVRRVPAAGPEGFCRVVEDLLSAGDRASGSGPAGRSEEP